MSHNEQILERHKKEQAAKEKEIHKLIISKAFVQSEFAKKLRVPLEMIESFFGQYFRVEDGLPVGYINGHEISSAKNPGNIAPFDEALEHIVEHYPQKHRLYPDDPDGTGSLNGAREFATPEEIKKMSLAEYEKAKKEGRIPKPGFIRVKP